MALAVAFSGDLYYIILKNEMPEKGKNRTTSNY